MYAGHDHGSQATLSCISCHSHRQQEKTKFMHTDIFLPSSPSRHKPRSSKLTPESISIKRKIICAILCVLDSVMGKCVERKIKQIAKLVVFMVLDDACCL
jgi:hypothetical protein